MSTYAIEIKRPLSLWGADVLFSRTPNTANNIYIFQLNKTALTKTVRL